MQMSAVDASRSTPGSGPAARGAGTFPYPLHPAPAARRHDPRSPVPGTTHTSPSPHGGPLPQPQRHSPSAAVHTSARTQRVGPSRQMLTPSPSRVSARAHSSHARTDSSVHPRCPSTGGGGPSHTPPSNASPPAGFTSRAHPLAARATALATARPSTRSGARIVLQHSPLPRPSAAIRRTAPSHDTPRPTRAGSSAS